jgi:hypothetical protein
MFMVAALAALMGPAASAQTFNDAARAQMCRNGMQAYCQPERRDLERSPARVRLVNPSRYIQTSMRRSSSVDPGECALAGAKDLGQFNLAQPKEWPRSSDDRIRS